MAAFTPTTTWATSDVLQASDVQAELDAVREYLRAIPNDAIATAWVDVPHIITGTFSSGENRAEYMTGDFAGRNSRHTAGRTYSSVYNTLRVGTNLWAYLPNTGLSLRVRRPCTMMISWYLTGGVLENYSAGAAGEADIRLYIGNPTIRYGEHTMLLEEAVADSDRLTYRQFPSGFHIIDFATAGDWKLGLCSMNTSSKMRAFHWGLSVEAFAL